jgi:hypothetical protein
MMIVLTLLEKVTASCRLKPLLSDRSTIEKDPMKPHDLAQRFR